MGAQWFSNMRLTSKMQLVPLFTLGIFLMIGISGHRYISFQHHLLLDHSRNMSEVENILTESGELRLIHANLYKILSWYNTGYDEKRISDLAEDQKKKIDGLLGRVSTIKGIDPALVTRLKAYNTHMKNALDMAATDLTLATTFVTPCEKEIDEIDKLLETTLSRKKAANDSALEKASETYRRIAASGVAAFVVSVLLIVVSGYFISKSVRRSIEKTIRNVEQMAQGDLTLKTGITSLDEVGRIAKAVDTMGETLGSLVLELQDGAETVVDESGKLSNISMTLVEGVGVLNSKSMSVEDSVTSAMEWISGIESAVKGVHDIIENIHTSVNDIDGTVSAIADNSQRVSFLTSEEAMAKIETSSGIINALNDSVHQINKITEIIKTVSAQTNLLALNATIEAVRAGSYGKGFGVVAEEVKNLARQTSQSASEIDSQIDSILAQSREAVSSVTELAECMKTINEISLDVSRAIDGQKHAINDISSIIASTGLTSREIADNVANSLARMGQIKTDVGMIFKTSDSTSDAANQIEKAVSRFGLVTSKLKNNIDFFRIEDPSV